MFRTCTMALAVALLSVPLAAAPVPAGGKAKDVSDLPVPANSLVVVQLNGLDRSKARVQKFLEPIDAEWAKETVGLIDDQWKQILNNRDLKGVDVNGRLFVSVGAFTPDATGVPPVAISIPVPDYKTFREKFLTDSERKSLDAGKNGVDEIEFEGNGKPLFLVDNKAGYVIATPNKDLAESFADKLVPLVAKSIGSVGESFLVADVSIYLNLVRVNELYAEQIQQGKQLFGLIAQQGGQNLDKRQLDLMKTVFDGTFQVVEDSTGLVFALEARPEGGNLRVDLAVKADTPTAKVLASEKPTALALLNAQPKGMRAYTASKWGKAFTDLQRAFGGEFGAPDGDDKLAAAITDWNTILASADGESLAFTGANMSSLNAMVFKDPAKVSDARLKVMKKMTGGATYSNMILKQNPEVKEASQKHAGFSLSSANIEVDYQASVRHLQDETAKDTAIETMKKLVPEKQTIWFGHDATRYVQLSAKDWDSAKELLDSFATPKAKIGDDAAFTLTRKQLPDEAGFLSLIDTNGLLETLGEYMNNLGGAIPAPGVELPKIGKVKGESAFVGLAFAARPLSARFDLFIPSGAIKSIRTAIAEGKKEKD
jgi:hypothetical protein